jgi:hypothetical protein
MFEKTRLLPSSENMENGVIFLWNFKVVCWNQICCDWEVLLTQTSFNEVYFFLVYIVLSLKGVHLLCQFTNEFFFINGNVLSILQVAYCICHCKIVNVVLTLQMINKSNSWLPSYCIYYKRKVPRVVR